VPFLPPPTGTSPYSSVTFNSTTSSAVSWALDGWAAGSVDSLGVKWTVKESAGWWDSTDVRLALESRPQDHGGFDGDSFNEPRYISLIGIAEAPNQVAAYQARDRIIAVCGDLAQRKALVVTEPHLTRRALVRRAGRTRVGDITDCLFDWQMDLVAPDYRKYADTLTTILTTLPVSGGSGFTAPFTGPITAPLPVGSTGVVVASNVGDVPTPPLVTITGAVTNPIVENITTGRRISLSYDLLAGDSLVVDFDNKVVLLNGTQPIDALAAGSSYWELAKGSNEIRYTALTGVSGSQMTLEFRSAW
jgi:hypothetical protein